MIAADFLLPVMGGDVKGDSGGAPALTVSPLPCLNSHNSTEPFKKESEKESGIERLDDHNPLKGNHLKTAFCLTEEIRALARKYGIQHLGFLTLTFADNVQTIKEASRRFNSLATHVLKDRYERAIGCVERMKGGRLHYHLVVVTGADTRTGCDIKAISEGDYKTASLALRAEWAFWRKTAKAYGFGRTEFLPVRSTADGIAKYVGKYIGKHMGKRQERDKGARLVKYLGFKGERVTSSQFAWASEGSRLWRKAVERFAFLSGARDLDELKELQGARWAKKLASSLDWAWKAASRENQGKGFRVEPVAINQERRWK